ncbi:hypothetical protein R1sor_017187 [Riccia sorocarpa]|uniref:glutathione transferase n=1 Tax=Riccia sorocarpa TaxID=122646 RepID=A0ABD3I638_9MARC
MTIKIYGYIRSPYVMAVGLTVYEKDQDFELLMMDMKSPEYRSNFNPFGMVPSYQDEDTTLFESKAIMRYVATKFADQGTPLLGSTIVEQALCNQWLEVHSHNLVSPLVETAMALIQNPPQPDVLKPALEKLNSVLDIYDARLSASKYLAGDSYTLADVTHTPFFHILNAITVDETQKCITSRPHLHAWIQDISSRPAWKKLIANPEIKDYNFRQGVKK